MWTRSPLRFSFLSFRPPTSFYDCTMPAGAPFRACTGTRHTCSPAAGTFSWWARSLVIFLGPSRFFSSPTPVRAGFSLHALPRHQRLGSGSILCRAFFLLAACWLFFFESLALLISATCQSLVLNSTFSVPFLADEPLCNCA